jgi:serine/threonine-protein kinase
LTYKPDEGLSLFKAKIPLDEEAKTYLEFAGPAGTFKRYSAVDVLSGAIPEKALANKIVLLGVTAPGLAPAFVVPSGESFTGLEIWATHIENILSQHFITRPPWAVKAEWGMIALAALVVILILPMLRARFAIPVAAVCFFGCLGASWFLFVKQGFWVSPTYGAFLLLSGFAVIVGKRLVFTEKGKELVEAEGVETNKMLGLSFQGQGMLDLAFEKFRRCPLDGSMKDLLYNLGLDMERKRQFSKAAAVYEHIAAKEPKYKDIQDKITLLKKAGEGAVFGSVGKKGNDATVVVEGLGQHTTLGRYEVMKELGRGAMGIVYLGKDPKINRQVAIKTLRFEEDMDAEQTKSVKERFFREAESAGNLTHPNIIRIFDAGEDQEVAYIAMELLDGHDLKSNCDKNNLLEMNRVVDIVAQVASGLDYAHKQGVVHRDIKPANIMMLKDGTLRITDFGIARIQATSKTATGAVLGTPAYMSPEHVNQSTK